MEIVISVKVAKKEGKGYRYPTVWYMVGLEGKVTGGRKKLLAMVGF